MEMTNRDEPPSTHRKPHDESPDLRFGRQGAKGRQGRQGAEQRWPEPSPELDDLAHRVIGVALEVHTVLGPGFLEQVYEDAMCLELGIRGIRFQRQLTLPVQYKNVTISESRLDLLVEESLVVEIKSVEALRPIHRAHVMSYLRAGEFQLGLLFNFNVAHLREAFHRVVWTG